MRELFERLLCKLGYHDWSATLSWSDSFIAPTRDVWVGGKCTRCPAETRFEFNVLSPSLAGYGGIILTEVEKDALRPDAS